MADVQEKRRAEAAARDALWVVIGWADDDPYHGAFLDRYVTKIEARMRAEIEGAR